MVDLAKRNTLIMLSGTAVVSAMPALASSYGIPAITGAGATDQSVEALMSVSGEGMELSVFLKIDEQPSVTITNRTDKLIILRHLHPGIVHAGDKTFDINSVFERCAHAVSAGKSRTLPIVETFSTQAEVQYPRNTKAPLRVANLVAHSPIGEVTNSTRSFYS